ncbi:hypothetical protein PENSPDRAFT_247040 [Peniophora sp. CONT]|nr:hypothetical protein PENSPDRAFT_247040 [Peniophora sp. CONT]
MFSVLFSMLVFAAVSVATPPEPTSPGTLYWMTNDPTGNILVTAPITSNGTIGDISVVATGGLGVHGDSFGVDSIFTQGPIAVHETSGRLAVVNPGSRSVSIFQLSDSSFPQPIGRPFPTYGDFPASAVFNKAGDVLCVLNGGVNSRVQCFSVDDIGLLGVSSSVPIYLYNKTSNPPTGPSGTGGTVRFTPDEDFLLVTTKGVIGELDDSPGFITVFPVTAPGIVRNEPTKVVIPPPAGIAFSLTEINDAKAFVGADLATGMSVYDYSNGWTNATIHELIIPGAVANCWSSYSTATGNYYFSDIGAGFINEVTLADDLTPSLVKQYDVGVYAGADESVVANVGDTQFLYVLLENATSIAALRLDGPGNASVVQIVDWSAPVKAKGHPVDQYNSAGLAFYAGSA